MPLKLESHLIRLGVIIRESLWIRGTHCFQVLPQGDCPRSIGTRSVVFHLLASATEIRFLHKVWCAWHVCVGACVYHGVLSEEHSNTFFQCCIFSGFDTHLIQDQFLAKWRVEE